MISVQTVVERMESILDSEGSDRYRFEQDFKPSINSSVEWMVSVFNAAFANKKITEEDLNELITSRVFQASRLSRVFFSVADVGEDRWSILRVSPEAKVYPETDPIPLSEDYDSKFMPELTFTGSEHSAKRLTLEKWNENSKNIFESGNNVLTNGFKSYAYINPIDYRSTGYLAKGAEIEIRPAVPGQFVGITYIKYPDPITSINDEIAFPKALTTLLVQKALNFISFKQGDQTNLFTVTARDVATLVQLMT